jgi:hypothetical protein
MLVIALFSTNSRLFIVNSHTPIAALPSYIKASVPISAKNELQNMILNASSFCYSLSFFTFHLLHNTI